MKLAGTQNLDVGLRHWFVYASFHTPPISGYTTECVYIVHGTFAKNAPTCLFSKTSYYAILTQLTNHQHQATRDDNI